jgi:cytoskeletal protein RodZ
MIKQFFAVFSCIIVLPITLQAADPTQITEKKESKISDKKKYRLPSAVLVLSAIRDGECSLNIIETFHDQPNVTETFAAHFQAVTSPKKTTKHYRYRSLPSPTNRSSKVSSSASTLSETTSSAPYPNPTVAFIKKSAHTSSE